MQLEHQEKKSIRCFADVLEALAFMFVEQAEPDDVPDTVDGIIEVGICFTGAANGSLKLITTQAVCDEVAINLLGCFDASELSPESSRDAIKELINITCGQFLTATAGTKPVFNLNPPTVIDTDNNTWSQMKDDESSYIFTIDDEPIIINIQIAA